jgi:hypothetical protein
MTVPASRKPRLQIMDDETRDGPRLNPGAPDRLSASEDRWVKDFMARLAASVRSLRRNQ